MYQSECVNKKNLILLIEKNIYRDPNSTFINAIDISSSCIKPKVFIGAILIIRVELKSSPKFFSTVY